MNKLISFFKKLNKATAYWGTHIKNKDNIPYSCFFCHKPIGFGGIHTTPFPNVYKGDCFRCSIDFDLINVETLWNIEQDTIQGFQIALEYSDRNYYIKYNMLTNTTIIARESSDWFNAAFKQTGCIFSHKNAKERLKTILVFS